VPVSYANADFEDNERLWCMLRDRHIHVTVSTFRPQRVSPKRQEMETKIFQAVTLFSILGSRPVLHSTPPCRAEWVHFSRSSRSIVPRHPCLPIEMVVSAAAITLDVIRSTTAVK